jgi:hypothetical protein
LIGNIQKDLLSDFSLITFEIDLDSVPPRGLSSSVKSIVKLAYCTSAMYYINGSPVNITNV